MKNNENFAKFFIPFSILVISLFVSYKYFEYKTIKDFIIFENKAEDIEYKLNEKGSFLSDKESEMTILFFGVGDTGTKKIIKKTDTELFTEKYNLSNDLINQTKIILDSQKTYGTTLSNYKSQYLSYKTKLNFIPSLTSKILREFIDNQLKYYQDEIAGNDNSQISSIFFLNYYQILQDRLILDSSSKAFYGKSKKYYADNYNVFSALEKYTRNDYKFIDEELIKTNRRYGYELLDKNRKYLGAYYELIKEYGFGDEESYSYKLEKYNTLVSNFNIDMNKVFSETEAESTERAKRIMTVIPLRYVVGKKFNNIGYKSLFGTVGLLNIDVSMCQGIQYRYSLYNSMTDKNPKGTTIDELISEFDSINISNREADQLIDKSLTSIVDSKDKISFECISNTSKEKFNFNITK